MALRCIDVVDCSTMQTAASMQDAHARPVHTIVQVRFCALPFCLCLKYLINLIFYTTLTVTMVLQQYMLILKSWCLCLLMISMEEVLHQQAYHVHLKPLNVCSACLAAYHTCPCLLIAYQIYALQPNDLRVPTHPCTHHTQERRLSCLPRWHATGP